MPNDAMPSAEAAVAHRSLDGRRFFLSGPLDLSRPATSVLDVVIRGRLHEFTAGPAALGAEVAAALGSAGFDEELSYAGGRLLVGRARPYDSRIRLVEDVVVAVWLGGDHALITQLYGMSTAHLLAILRSVRITVHDDGLALAPAGDAAFAGPATVVKEVPALGLLETSPLTADHARTLPAWSGRPTPAGELFTDTLSSGDPFFVLATADSWTTVVPLAGTTAAQMAARIGRLRVGTAV